MKNRSGGPHRGTWVALGVAYLARRHRKAKKARVRGQSGQPVSAGAFSPPPRYAYAAPSVVHQPASASLLRWLVGIAVGVVAEEWRRGRSLARHHAARRPPAGDRCRQCRPAAPRLSSLLPRRALARAGYRLVKRRRASLRGDVVFA